MRPAGPPAAGAPARANRAASLTDHIAYGKVRVEGVVALVFVPAALMLLMWALSLLFRSAPLMAMGLSGFSGMVIYELHRSERGHGMVASNSDIENRFWGYMVSGVFFTLFFSPDSPAASVGWSYPLEALFLVLFIGMLVYLWDRSHHINSRREVRSWDNQRRRNSYYLDNQESKQANTLLDDVESLLSQLKFDNPLELMSKALPKNRRRSIRVQRKILELLRGAKKQHLNFLLSRINLRTMFHRLKDTDILVGHGAKRNFRTQLLELLCTDRHGEGLLEVVPEGLAGGVGGDGNTNISAAPASATSAEQGAPGGAAATNSVTVVTGGIKTEEEVSNPQPSLVDPTPPPSPMVQAAEHGRRHSMPSIDLSTSHLKLRVNKTSSSGPAAVSTPRGTTRPGLQRRDSPAIAWSARPRKPVGGRLDELDVISKASILAALQEIRLTADPRVEEMVVAIFRSTSSSRLTRLKMMLDHRCSSDCLHKLIYRDIDDPERRLRILDHIVEQGERLKRERSVREAVLKSQRQRADSSGDGDLSQHLAPRHVKILSDIDDTLFSSAGHFPAGIDKSYGKHVLYPGVLRTYRELDLSWKKGRPGNLAFLSARPHVYKGVLETTAFARFRELHERGDMHCAPTMLAGALDTGSYLFWGNYEPMARQKFKNFEEFSALWPECSFVFVGDNGQGDVRVGELMLSGKGEHGRKMAESVDAVFIHVVQPIEATPGYSPSASKRWKDLGIIFFKTYVGLVVEACKRGMLPVESIFRVAASASEEFERTEFGSEADRTVQRLQLNRDLTKANDFIHEIRHGNQICDSSSNSSSGDSGDDAESSSITWRSSRRRKGNAGLRKKKTKARRSGGFRLTARLVAALGSSRRSSADLYIPYLQKQVPIRFAVGDAVVTCCGEGMPGKIIAGPRKGDGMYTVRLSSKFRTRTPAGGGGDGGDGSAASPGIKARSSGVDDWYSSERTERSSGSSNSSTKLGDGFRSKSYLSMSALASSFEMVEGTSSSSSASLSPSSSSLSAEQKRGDRLNPTSEDSRRSSVGSRRSSGLGGYSQRKSFGAMVYAPAAALKRVAMLPPGTALLTPFGTGVLDEVRLVDGIHCVTMTKIYHQNRNHRDALRAEQVKDAGGAPSTFPEGKSLQGVSSSESSTISVKVIPVEESSGVRASISGTGVGAAGAAGASESMDADEDDENEKRKEQAAINAAALESATKAAALAAHERKTSTGVVGGVILRKSVMTGYLNARDVLRKLDAAVGDRVKTAIGDGLVVDYRSRDNTYVIKLFTGKSDASALRLAGTGMLHQSQTRRQFWSTLYLSGDSRLHASKLQRLPQEENAGNRCVIQ